MRTLGARVPTLVLGLILGTLTSSALAQGIPYVPPELHQDLRRLQGDRITVCIWPGLSPTVALDRAIAEAIGDVLLVQIEIYEYASSGVLSPDEFSEEIYIQLGAHCDAIAGFILATHGFPEWLIPSRPYLNAPFVLVVRDDAPYQSLADVPTGSIIGSQVYTEGDLQLLNYLRAAPEQQRWRRFPYASGEALGRHIAQETLQAGLMWQPSWRAIADAGGLREASARPLPPTTSGVGFVFRVDNDFVRNAIDVAIAALESEGMLSELAEQYGFVHVVP
jgi:ABC-type amino acid transport substrate-binding protein